MSHDNPNAKKARRIEMNASRKRHNGKASAVLALVAAACGGTVPVLARNDVPPPLFIADAANYPIAHAMPDASPAADAPAIVESPKFIDAHVVDAALPNNDDVALFERQCRGGSMRDCTRLGAHYLNGESGSAKDPARAASLFDQACTGGYAFGCTSLAMLVRHGTGVMLDLQKSLSLFKLACDRNDPSGCTALGYDYDVGLGTHADALLASNYYRRGCDGGDDWGCNNLALLLQHGAPAVARDLAQASALFQKACQLGNTAACASLASLKP